MSDRYAVRCGCREFSRVQLDAQKSCPTHFNAYRAGEFVWNLRFHYGVEVIIGGESGVLTLDRNQ
jgi:hypothetical protein